jgi:hypothetical protein
MTLTGKQNEKEATTMKGRNKNKNKKTMMKKGESHAGSAMHPLEIENDKGDWNGSMQEKWKTLKQQETIQYNFDLMVKYKQLQDQGFDNYQILKMIPDM